MRSRRRDAAIPDDPITTLSAWERAALTMVRRRGIILFVLAASTAAVLASVALATIGMVVFGGFDDERFWRTAYGMSTVIPALVAPPVTFMLARLVDRLDRVSRRMRVLAVTDPLTGVGNRRGFFEVAASLGEAPSGHCVAIFDIDEFKRLNDAHGHPTGDDALRRLAEWLTDLVGESGHVARFGGDEFVAIGPSNRFDAVARRVAFVVADAEFSVSVGRAGWVPGGDLDRALARADDDLYKTKIA